MSIGPGLRWALGLSLASSAAALLLPRASTVDARLNGATSSMRPAPATELAAQMFATAAHASLRFDLTKTDLQNTNFDPFVGVIPPAPQPAPIVALAAAPAPPPPAPPPMTYRFLGRLVDPFGIQQIYLSHGDSSVIAVVGASLEDGYVIDAISDDAIALHHSSTGTRVLLPIPPAGNSTLP